MTIFYILSALILAAFVRAAIRYNKENNDNKRNKR